MDVVQPNRRTDEQLVALLNEPSNWTVSGRNGAILCSASSLGNAIDRASEYARRGAVVIALCRLPFDNVVIFPAQIDRLRKIRAGLEVPVIRILSEAAQ